VLVVVAALAAIGLVVLSPLGLGVLDEAGDRDWRRLSEIGQTYGAVTALLSVLALGGVVGSLVLQSRASRLDRELAHRTIHVELMKMAIDDPTLLRIWGRWGTETPENQRYYAYINLFVSFWEMAYDARIRTSEELAASADGLFASELGRSFWKDRGASRVAASRRMRELHALLDERWQRAVHLAADAQNEGTESSPVSDSFDHTAEDAVTVEPLADEEE
jgi:hypothetical protein